MPSLMYIMQRFILFLCIPYLFARCIFSWLNISMPLFISVCYDYGYIPGHSFYQKVENIAWWGKVSFFIVDNVEIAFLALALWYFWQLLSLYIQALYFSLEAIDNLKKIMRCLLGWSIYKLLFPTIASLVISCFKEAGHRSVVVMIGSDDVIRFFVVLIVSVILQVVQEAYKIKSEQDLVV